MLEEKREQIIKVIRRNTITKMKFIEKFKKYEKKKKGRKRYIVSEDEYNQRKYDMFKLTEYKNQILNVKSLPALLKMWEGILREDTIMGESFYYKFFERNISFYTHRLKEEPERTYLEKQIEISMKGMKKLIEGKDAFRVVLDYQNELLNS